MKKIAIAAALVMIGASAHAGTYSGAHQAKVYKTHKDTTRFVSAKQEEAAPTADAIPAKTPDAAAPTAPADAAPAER